MNKKITAYLAVIIILSSLSLCSTSQSLTLTSATLSSSGSILQTVSPRALNREVTIYGTNHLDSAQIANIANNYDMLICNLIMERSVVQSLKAANPNLQIYGYCDAIATLTYYSYWPTANANEAWFVHDANGNRVRSTSYGWYLMNPGSTGWVQFFSTYVNSQLSNSLFDGLFADDVWNEVAEQLSWGLLTPSNVPSSIVSNWHENMAGMLGYVRGQLPSGKQMIINTNEYLTHDYLDAVDGKYIEGLAHAPWWDIDYFQSSSFDPIEYIDTVIRDSALGKTIVSQNGAVITSNTNPNKIVQNAIYCYAATLLGTNGGNCYFGYNAGESFTYTYGYGVSYSAVSENLGAPLSSYYRNQNVYMRNFTGGRVLFNPSSATYNVNLGSNYRLMDGTYASSVAVGPWSGVFLYR